MGNEIARLLGIGAFDEMRVLLAGWIEKRNRLIDETRKYAEALRPMREALSEESEQIRADLDAWGEWLNRQGSLRGEGSGGGVTLLILSTEKSFSRHYRIYGTQCVLISDSFQLLYSSRQCTPTRSP